MFTGKKSTRMVINKIVYQNMFLTTVMSMLLWLAVKCEGTSNS